MADPMSPEDEQRLRELIEIHPALLQSEAIEMRRHLLDAREDLAEARAELEQWRATFGETALRDARHILAERDSLRDTVLTVATERDRLAEQVKRVRELHPKQENPRYGCCANPKVCNGHPPVCAGTTHGLDKPRWPCMGIRALDGTEAGT